MENYIAKPDKTLLEHTKDVKEQLEVMRRIGYIPNQKIFCLTYHSCEHHDKGKANREFQKRIVCRYKFNADREIAHNVLSLYFIKKDDYEDDEDYHCVAYAVLTHHDYCDEYEVITQQKVLIKELLSEFEEVREIGTRTLKRILEMKYNPKAILIKGLLMRCDYSASAGLTVE
jgi:CRISPR-associated endonuclease/helicase Cas3